MRFYCVNLPHYFSLRDWQEVARSLVSSMRWVWRCEVLVGIVDGVLVQWMFLDAAQDRCDPHMLKVYTFLKC